MVSPNPGLLAALLKTGRLTGVVRWKVVLTDDVLGKECMAAGWRPLVLNTTGAKSVEDFLHVSAVEIDLGVDAQASITNWTQALTTKFMGETPVCITWVGWQDIVGKSPSDATMLVSIFEDVLKDGVGLVLIAGHQGNFPGVDELALA